MSAIPISKTPQLDAQLTFEDHLKVITTKVNKTIGLIQKLQNVFPRPALMTIYKAFVRPHLDYGDIIMMKLTKHFTRNLSLFNIMPA